MKSKTTKIVIAGATGNVGRRIAMQLKESGVELTLLGRDLNALKQLNIPNANLVVADLGNPEQVTDATKDADALFWLVPPVLSVSSLQTWYEEVTYAGVTAVKTNGIRKVVLLSSLGAGASGNLGTVTYAGHMEQAFDTLEADVLALRPGYFMENFLLQSASLLEQGEFTFTYAPDHDIPFVSTDDIGDTVASYLLNDNWTGHWKLNLMGPENITLEQAAGIISGVMGREIRYRQVSLAESKNQLDALGVGEKVRNELIDLFEALGDPHGAYATPRTYEAASPTSLGDVISRKLLRL